MEKISHFFDFLDENEEEGELAVDSLFFLDFENKLLKMLRFCLSFLLSFRLPSADKLGVSISRLLLANKYIKKKRKINQYFQFK